MRSADATEQAGGFAAIPLVFWAIRSRRAGISDRGRVSCGACQIDVESFKGREVDSREIRSPLRRSQAMARRWEIDLAQFSTQGKWPMVRDDEGC